MSCSKTYDLMNSQEENKLRYISFSIVVLRMRRKESSASQPKTDQKLDKVNYSTGDVDLNQNAAYETVKYTDEVIYEHAT